MTKQPHESSLPPAVETAIQSAVGQTFDMLRAFVALHPDDAESGIDAAEEQVVKGLRSVVALAVAHTQQAERKTCQREVAKIQDEAYDAADEHNTLLAWTAALPPAPDGAQEG